MNKTVLITGAYGFFGRHVAQYFSAQGYHVTGIGHGTWSRAEWERWGLSEWHTCDVTLDALITYGGRPDVIVHCAGSASVPFSMENPYFDCKRTVETTLDALEFVRLYCPQARFIYPSSAGVYGTVKSKTIRVSEQRRPDSPYGMHNKMAEDLCLSYSKHFNISSAIVRFFSLYGKGLRKQLLWDACEKIKKGESTFYGTGDEVRDWLNVSDAASLLCSVVPLCSAKCPVFNGGTGRGASTRAVLETIFKQFQIQDGPHFSGAARSGDPSSYVADLSDDLVAVWQPVVAWESGVKEYVEWYKELAK